MTDQIRKNSRSLPSDFWFRFVCINLVLIGSYQWLKRTHNIASHNIGLIVLGYLSVMGLYALYSAFVVWRSANSDQYHFIWQDFAKVGVIYGVVGEGIWLYIQIKPVAKLLG